MEEEKPIQSYFRDRKEVNQSISLSLNIEIPGPGGLILLPPTFNTSKCCGRCVHMFTPGPHTLRKHVNTSEEFHEERGQKYTEVWHCDSPAPNLH